MVILRDRISQECRQLQQKGLMDCIQENRNNKESLKETKWRTMDMGELEYKVETQWGVYGADKQSKGTLTPRGEEQVA